MNKVAKKIAVTGATGFVGGHLVRALRAKGYSVKAYGRKKTNGITSWDITKGPLDAPPAVDVVVHCAGSVDDWAEYSEAYEGNVVGTENVLASFPAAPLFVHISSASVYDSFVPEQVLTEESRCGNFLNAYSKTKHEAELRVAAAGNSHRVILRPHIVYGPGDTTVLPRILKARKLGRFLVIGDGKNLLSITHVENLVHAILRTLESNLSDGCEVFNIADESRDSVDTLISALCEALGISERILHIPRMPAYILGFFEEKLFRFFGSATPPLITRYAVAQMAYGHALDIAKARKVLGYAPTLGFREGFSKMKI